MKTFGIGNGRMAGYVCRSCGYTTSYQGNFRKCPVCGIKWS
jgi:rubrerythrin